jgi:hypothetical protein
MKPGKKLKSAVCDTEVIVVRATPDVLVSCGGAPMLDAAPEVRGALNPDFAGGAQMGKRYQDAAGTTELLCIKGGKGALAIDGALATVKAAKALPSSD